MAIAWYGVSSSTTGGRIACMSCFAIGAAIAPPKPCRWLSTTTAPATIGSSAGAKKMNQAS